MKITSRAVDGITILDMDGRMTLGDDIAGFKNAIAGLVADGHKMVLLNLRDVPYVDSSGIGELVAAFTNLRNSGGELKLLNLTQKIRTLLQITRLYSVFDVKEDEASAILSFSATTTA
jgi:anti-sigma B factor antagonist